MHQLLFEFFREWFVKSKLLLRLALLGVLAGYLNSSALAADATADELKRVTEENTTLKKTLAEEKSDNENSSAYWGNFAMKSWSTTMTPWDGTSSGSMAEQFTLTQGYARYFLSLSIDGAAKYVKPISNGAIEYISAGWNLGYVASPDWIVALGLKNANDAWVGISAPSTSANVANHYFTTIGTAYSYAFADSPFSINAGITYGQRTPVGCNCVTGSPNVSETYLGYDLGGIYALSKRFKFNLFYRIEQWDMVAPTAGITASVAMMNRTVGGPGIGALYLF